MNKHNGKIIMIKKLNDNFIWLEYNNNKLMAPLELGNKYFLGSFDHINDIVEVNDKIKMFYSIINNVNNFYNINNNNINLEIIDKNNLNNKVNKVLDNKNNLKYLYIINNTGNKIIKFLRTKNNNIENFIIPTGLVFTNNKWLKDAIDNLYNEVSVHAFVNYELYGIYLDYITNIENLSSERNLDKRFEKYFDILTDYLINKKYFRYAIKNKTEKENIYNEVNKKILNNNNLGNLFIRDYKY